MVNCLPCPGGWVNEKPKNTACKSCTAGLACPAASALAYTCPSGYVSSSDNSISCQDCPEGRAQPLAKSASCNNCPRGKYSAFIASNACSSCRMGEFADVINSLKCSVCPQGYKSNVSASPECTFCPLKYKSTLEENSTSCTACIMGEIQTPKTRTCFKCNQGFYSLFAGEQLATEFDDKDPSLAKCHPQPEGAVCRGLPTLDGQLKTLNSWWRSSNLSTSIVR
jgi:hypothetical protein